MKFLFLNFILKSVILGIIFFSINQLLFSKDSFSELQFINITSYTLFLNDVANETSSDDLYSGIKEIFRYGEPGYYHYQNQVQASLDPTLFLSKKSAEYYCRWKNNCGSYLPSVHCFLRSNSSQEIAEIDASLYSNQICFFISQREELHDCKEEEKVTTASLWNDRVAAGIVIMGIITAGAWWSSPSCRRSDREQRLSSPECSSDQDGLLHKKITQKERGESPQDAFFIRSNLSKTPSRQDQKNLTPLSYQYFASSDLTRIFHTDRNEEAAKADGARRAMKSDDGCVSTHCPRKSLSSTQHPSDFPVSVGDRYEIFGLTWSSGKERGLSGS